MEHIALTREDIKKVQDIIDGLDAQPPGPGTDRRVRPRIDYAQPMWLCLIDKPEMPWVHIFSRNLSTGGLAFLTRREFLPGEHLVLSHHLGEQVSHLALGCVKFCRVVYAGIWEAGVEFVAARPDPHQAREIPPEWVATALRTAWLARQMQSPF